MVGVEVEVGGGDVFVANGVEVRVGAGVLCATAVVACTGRAGVAAGFRCASLSKVQATRENIKIIRKKMERIPTLFNFSGGIVIS